MNSKTIAIILSGGTGSRFGGNLPKQFAKLAGKAVIEYTIQQFEDSHCIDEILIVSQSQMLEKTWSLVKRNHCKKVSRVILGGKERFDSTWSALQALSNEPDDTKILLHDAVRPLITESIIQECADKLSLFEAVDVVIPSSDTLVEVYDDGCIANIPNRSLMRRGQTPQGFRLGVLRQAYLLANQQKRTVFTCDCGVVRSMLPHIRVATVSGDERNIKITHPIDLFVAEKLLQISKSDDLNIPDLSFLRNKVIVIFGGSSGIGKSMHDIALLQGAQVFVASRRSNNVDITDKNGVAAFLESVSQQVQSIHYVVNTAGLLLKKPIDSLTETEISELIDINYRGALNVAMASRRFLSSSKGMLLNFTSSSYTRGRAYYAIYSSLKSAIVNLTQALAEEWGAFGIRVNCINPERTSTPMRTTNFGVEDPDLLLSAEEVARRSLAVLSNKGSGVVTDIRKDGR